MPLALSVASWMPLLLNRRSVGRIVEQLRVVPSNVSKRITEKVPTLILKMSLSPAVPIEAAIRVSLFTTGSASACAKVLFGSISFVTSSRQLLLQPSPSEMLPSSHCSLGDCTLSPHDAKRSQLMSQSG